jgi:hypothetical protein
VSTPHDRLDDNEARDAAGAIGEEASIFIPFSKVNCSLDGHGALGKPLPYMLISRWLYLTDRSP